MIPKHSPDSPAGIQVRLKYLKERKVVLDELIASLERYSVCRMPPSGELSAPRRKEPASKRLAGAA